MEREKLIKEIRTHKHYSGKIKENIETAVEIINKYPKNKGGIPLLKAIINLLNEIWNVTFVTQYYFQKNVLPMIKNNG